VCNVLRDNLIGSTLLAQRQVQGMVCRVYNLAQSGFFPDFVNPTGEMNYLGKVVKRIQVGNPTDAFKLSMMPKFIRQCNYVDRISVYTYITHAAKDSAVFLDREVMRLKCRCGKLKVRVVSED
jgi:hypothetical protein